MGAHESLRVDRIRVQGSLAKVAQDYEAYIDFWDRAEVSYLVRPGNPSGSAGAAGYSALHSGSGDCTIRIWDAETDQKVIGPLAGHSGPVRSVAFSPDGRRVVSGSNLGVIRIWDAKTGQTVIGPLQGHKNWVNSVAFSPDGRHVVPGSYDWTIRIRDAETGQTVTGLLEGHSDWVDSVAFSPDASHVVSGSTDQTVRIWDAETGQTVIGPLEGHSGGVNSVAFSPDGGHVVSGSYDKTIRIWDAETGQTVIGSLKGHSGEVTSVAFSPDGRRVVPGSNDRTIRIWDAETSSTIASPLGGHSSHVSPVASPPNQRYLASSSGNFTVHELHAVIPYSKDLDQSYPFFHDSSPMEDGWVLGPNSELLFWVPPSLRVGLWRPGNTLFIGKFTQTRLNLDFFVHGGSWNLCKTQDSPGNEGISDAGPFTTLASSSSSNDNAVSTDVFRSVPDSSSGHAKRKASQNLSDLSGVVGVTRKKARLEGD